MHLIRCNIGNILHLVCYTLYAIYPIRSFLLTIGSLLLNL